MDAKEYQKFEAGDIPEDEELRCLREENRRLKGEYKRGHAIGMKMLDDKIREKNLLLNAENRKLREAFNAAKNYIIKTDFDPDFSPKTNRAYLKYIKAKKVLDNVNTESI